MVGHEKHWQHWYFRNWITIMVVYSGDASVGGVDLSVVATRVDCYQYRVNQVRLITCNLTIRTYLVFQKFA